MPTSPRNPPIPRFPAALSGPREPRRSETPPDPPIPRLPNPPPVTPELRRPESPRAPPTPLKPRLPQAPPSPRLPLTPLLPLPLFLALTLPALLPTARPASAQAIQFVGEPVELGLVQRAPLLSGLTDLFSGSLLVSDRRGLWAPSPLPNDLTDSAGGSPGTEATLFGGGRALAGGRFRHADRTGGGSFFEIAGHYLRGTDWSFADPVEERLREESALLPPRDDQMERWGGEIRYDPRPDDPDGWAFEAGFDRLRGNQLTEVGAAYARGWTRWHGQARYSRGDFGAGVEVRGRGAGDALFHRTAREIEDRSLYFSGDLSHVLSIDDRHFLHYGLGVHNALPMTGGTLTGVYEDADGIRVAEGRFGSTSRLSERLSVETAMRVGSHSRVQGLNLSGHATLNFQPAFGHSLQARAGRELVLPFTENFHLDVTAGRMTAGVLIYDIMARGVPESGFTFNDRCPGGFQDLCMRSPLAPGRKLPADPAVLWNTLVEIAAASDPLALRPLRQFFRDPEPGELKARLLLFNQKEWEAGRPPFLGEDVLGRPIGIRPVDPLQPTIAHTLALSYDVSVGTGPGSRDRDRAGPAVAVRDTGRGHISASIWHSRIDNFVGPLRMETPTVFFEPESLRAFIVRRVDPMVRLGIVYPQLRDLLIHDLTNLASQLPVGTIMPDQVTAPGLLLTYRNYGTVDVSGVNLSASVRLTPALTLRGDHRYVTEECFDFFDDVASDCSKLEDISLNVPKTRSSLSVRHQGRDSGFVAEARMRRQRGFYANAGVHAGDVEGYTVLDAQVDFPLPGLARARAAITATNLLDDRHQEFVGAPEIGRLIVAGLSYAFR